MTMSTQSCVVTYAGNGELTEFPYNFKIFNDTDLKGVVRDADGNETPLAAGTDFTVSGTGDPRGGSVTYPVSGAPLPEGASLTLHRELDFTQTLELVENDPFPAKLIEQEFDKAVMRDQQIKERIDRAPAYSVAASTEERLSCEEYVDAVQTAKSKAETASDETETARSDASNAAARADAHAAEAALQSDRAEAAAVNAESMGGWWSTLSVNAAPSGDASFNVPGNFETIFTVGRALKLTDSSNETVCGYVSGAEYNGSDATAVSATCSVPADLQSVEYGQDVDNTPRPGPAAMIPEVTGPASGNEKACVDFSVVRIDGSEYTDEAEFFLNAIRDSDGTDISATFTLSKTNASTLRLTLPDVDMDTPAELRFSAIEGVLGCSEWSAPMPFTTKHVTMTADNAAVFNSLAADWPIQNADTACSKTVQQEEGEADWTNLSAQVGIDATDANLQLSVIDSYNSGTLQCSDPRSGLSGPWAMFADGSDTGVVVTDEPTESTSGTACLYNPSDKASEITLSNGNKTAAGTTAAYASVRADTSRSTGKYYFEMAIDARGINSLLIGVADTDSALSSSSWKGLADNDGWTINLANGYAQHDTSQALYDALGKGSTGDVFGVAVDFTSGKIWFSKNGSWLGSGNPETGANAAASSIAEAVKPYVMTESNGAAITLQTSVIDITYDMPTGYSAWDDVVSTYSWTGLDEAPTSLATVSKVFQLPECFVGTGGEVTVPQGDEELTVVSNDPLNSLVSTHPDSGVISVGTNLVLDGSQVVDVTEVTENGGPTNTADTFSNGAGFSAAGGYTLVGSRKVTNSKTIVSLALTNHTTLSGWIALFKNTSGTTFEVVSDTVTSFTLSAADTMEYFDLTLPFVVPATGDYYIGWYSEGYQYISNSNGDSWYYNGEASGSLSFTNATATNVGVGYRSGVYEYTCTINPAASSTVTSAATAGTPLKVKELIVSETALDVVSKNGTALTVKYPTALAGLFRIDQHDAVKVNGSTVVNIDSVGAESDVGGEDNLGIVGGTLSSYYGTAFTHLPLGGSEEAKLENGLTVESISYKNTLATTAGAGKIKILQRTGTDTYDVKYDEAVTITLGSSTTHELTTPFEIPATGDYFVALYCPVNSMTRRYIPGYTHKVVAGDATGTSVEISGDTNNGYPPEMSVTYAGGKQTVLILATDPGAVTSAVVPSRFPASAETPSSVVRSDLTVGEETHDKLTITHSLRSITPEARSTAIAVSRSDSETDQTCAATINLYTGA